MFIRGLVFVLLSVLIQADEVGLEAVDTAGFGLEGFGFLEELSHLDQKLLLASALEDLDDQVSVDSGFSKEKFTLGTVYCYKKRVEFNLLFE